jgi:transposase
LPAPPSYPWARWQNTSRRQNDLSDDALGGIDQPTAVSHPYVAPDCAAIHQTLKRKGVTLQLLWHEYRAEHGVAGYAYSQFCILYRQLKQSLKRSMRQTHPASEKLFVDYAGQTVPIADPPSGEIRRAQIFVAVLGAYNYTFAEATWSQQLPDWLGSHVRALVFFGGAPAMVVSDNLKSGVNHACRYDPDINLSYAELAAHYGMAVIPARPRKPQDKAKVEVEVQIVERWMLAALRKQTFFSLHDLNSGLRTLLYQHNSTPSLSKNSPAIGSAPLNRSINWRCAPCRPSLMNLLRGRKPESISISHRIRRALLQRAAYLGRLPHQRKDRRMSPSAAARGGSYSKRAAWRPLYHR